MLITLRFDYFFARGGFLWSGGIQGIPGDKAHFIFQVSFETPLEGGFSGGVLSRGVIAIRWVIFDTCGMATQLAEGGDNMGGDNKGGDIRHVLTSPDR